MPPVPQDRKKADESPLGRVTRDATTLALEQVQGLTAQTIKDLLFNRPLLPPAVAMEAAGAGAAVGGALGPTSRSAQQALAAIPIP